MQSHRIADYRELIAKYSFEYVGREWVRNEVDAFIRERSSRFLVFTGAPGSGKSAVMAALVNLYGFPHHFIGKGSQLGLSSSFNWRNPVRFAESVGYQLLRDYGSWVMDWDQWGIHIEQKVKSLSGLLVGARFDTFKLRSSVSENSRLTVDQEIEQYGEAGRAIGVYIDKFIMDVPEFINQLFVVPCRTIHRKLPEHQLVFLIDGLDEAEKDLRSGLSIADIIMNSELPDSVKFIYSTRPAAFRTTTFQSAPTVCWLSTDDSGVQSREIMQDAQVFVSKLLGNLLAGGVVENEDVPRIQERVLRSSQGNFLYLHHFAVAVLSGNLPLLRNPVLPVGLQGIYRHFLELIKSDRDDVSWNGAYKPVLGCLSIAKEPLSRKQLARFSSVSEQTVATIVMNIKDFLHLDNIEGGATRYSLYHPSFAEYLISAENEDYIDPEEAHARLASYYKGNAPTWRTVLWPEIDEYGLRYLSFHLFSLRHLAQYRNEQENLICLAFMREKQSRMGTLLSFITDVELAIQAVDKQSPRSLAILMQYRFLTCIIEAVSTEPSWETIGLMARLGLFDRAIQITDRYENAYGRRRGYQLVAEAYEDAGNMEYAQEYYVQSLRAGLAISRDSDASDEISQLAPQMCRVGIFAKWLDLVCSVSDDGNQDRILLKSILLLIESGSLSQAREAANRLLSARQRLKSLSEIVSALIANDQRETARAITLQVENELAIASGGLDLSLDSAALCALSRCWLALSEPSRALPTAKKALSAAATIASDPIFGGFSEKEGVLFLIADLFGEMDAVESLETFVKQSELEEDESLRLRSLAAAARAMVRSGHRARGEQIAEKVLKHIQTLVESIGMRNIDQSKGLSSRSDQDNLWIKRVMPHLIEALAQKSESLDQIVDILRNLEPSVSTVDVKAMHEIMKTFALVKQWHSFYESAKLATNYYYPDHQRELVRILFEAGKVQEAQNFSYTGSLYQIYAARCQVAELLADRGDKAPAIELASSCLETLETDTKLMNGIWSIVRVLQKVWIPNSISRIQAIAETKDRFDRESARLMVAKLAIKSGDRTVARAILKDVLSDAEMSTVANSDTDYAQMVGELGFTYFDRGDEVRGMQFVEDLATFPRLQILLLCRAAKSMKRFGSPTAGNYAERACDLAMRVCSDDSNTLNRVIEALAATDRVATMMEVVDVIMQATTTDDIRSEEQGYDIAQALTAVGRIDEARQRVSKMHSIEHQNAATKHIAVYLGRHGDPNLALQLAFELKSAYSQVDTVCEVMEALPQGFSDQSIAILKEMYAQLEPWIVSQEEAEKQPAPRAIMTADGRELPEDFSNLISAAREEMNESVLVMPVKVLCRLARTFTKCGDGAAATEMLRRAIESAKKVRSRKWKRLCLVEIAPACVLASMIPEALDLRATFDELNQPKTNHEPLLEQKLIEAFEEIGERSRALSLWRPIMERSKTPADLLANLSTGAKLLVHLEDGDVLMDSYTRVKEIRDWWRTAGLN